jgi:hypothetical protein
METSLTEWKVTGIKKKEHCIILSGPDPDAVIQALQEYGRNAILKIGDLPHFIFVTSGQPETIESADITVFKSDKKLIVSRGAKETTERSVLTDYLPRDGVWEGKPALFYKNGAGKDSGFGTVPSLIAVSIEAAVQSALQRQTSETAPVNETPIQRPSFNGDYRQALKELIDSQYGNHREFCAVSGIKEAMLSQVLSMHGKHFSIQTLVIALEKIGYGLAIVPQENGDT